MIASTVWNQLVLTLKENPTLAGYVKNVFEGQRYELESESLPCIMLEPTGNNEGNRRTNNIKDVYLTIDVFAISSANYHEFPKTIVGGQDYKGILDIENDIIGCLESSNTLGNQVIDITFEPTRFDQAEIGKYPVRGLVIPIKILYRQQNNI